MTLARMQSRYELYECLRFEQRPLNGHLAQSYNFPDILQQVVVIVFVLVVVIMTVVGSWGTTPQPFILHASLSLVS